MAKRPRPSGIAALWAAFIKWVRTSHVLRAGSKLTGHVLLGMWWWFIMWLSEKEFHYFYVELAQEPKFFDWIPVKWLIDAIKFGVLVTIGIWGIIDTWRELSR
jgi:hypothetical protein